MPLFETGAAIHDGLLSGIAASSEAIQNRQLMDQTMTKCLLSFPVAAMEVPADDIAAGGRAAHEVIREAKAAGVDVFGGGTNNGVEPPIDGRSPYSQNEDAANGPHRYANGVGLHLRTHPPQ